MRIKLPYVLLGCLIFNLACSEPDEQGGAATEKVPSDWQLETYTDVDNYPGVPQSTIYEVVVRQGDKSVKIPVFQSICPEFQLGYKNMIANDRYPLEIFAGRSISWVNFSFSGEVVVEVTVIDKKKVPLFGGAKVLPSRYGISAATQSNVVTFTMKKPGQCSVEIGMNGYKNGLMIFANPIEENAPESTDATYAVVDHASVQDIASVQGSASGLYFKSGIHDIGVYQVPANIKNIYLEGGAWVYGSIIMDGRSDVKIFGRGVLSQGRLDYRESHAIEAINGSNNIVVEGVTVADTRFFSVRLIGTDNRVDWVKIIGAWTYNCDGISAFAGSTVSNCFTWANDDNIKVYRDNTTVTDMVCWQLNNGASIQMSWGGATAENIKIQRVDILHAEWNNSEINRGVLSCVGDKYEAGKSGYLRNWLIEDLVTETSVPLIFRLSPHNFSPCPIHGLTMRNWSIKMNMAIGFKNYIQGLDPKDKFDGFVFDNVVLNGTRLTSENWISTGKFEVANLVQPVFK